MSRIKNRRQTAANWTAINPTLFAGEIGVETDSRQIKIGDGVTAWTSLLYASAVPTSHSHGNITNAGAIGSTANLPIITTTSGVLTTGSFGTTANTFCQGNDSRLSDTRTPTDGSVTTAKIANSAVTYAKIQNVSATDKLLGRSSANAGVVEEITCTSFARSILDDASAADVRSTLSVQPTASPAFTGAATFDNTGNVVPLTITNAGTANSFVVNDASGDTTPFVIDADGQVGIGGSPTQKLQIHGGTAADVYLRISNTDTGTSSGFLIGLNGNEEGVLRVEPNQALTFGTNNTERLRITSTGVVNIEGGGSASAPILTSTVGTSDTGLWFPAADVVAVSTAGVERVRVDASGRVGIGVSPLAALHVFGNNGIFGTSAFFGINASTSGVAIGNSGTIGQIQGQTAAGTGTAANIALQANGGDVLIGTTTDNGAYLLQVNSQIYATNATIATSDARFKTRVESLTDATAIVEALRPVAFDFIPQAERNFSTDRQIGLIAQETQAALAGTDYAASVVAQCGDHLGLAYEKLVPLLIKALQESNARIAALEEKINA
jgi:hypothetical protein